MFGLFKDIKTWSKKKLRWVKIAFDIIYAIFMLVIPTIIVCSKYKLFENAPARIKVTGVGVIFLIVIGMYAFKKFKDVVAKMPQITYNQQCFKFALEMVLTLLPMGLIIFGFWMAREQTQIAYNTMLGCLVSIFCANLVYYLFIKFIEQEQEIREAALFDKEKEARKGLV